MWVVIPMFMETTQGIFLYSSLHLKLAKTLCFSFNLLWFFFNKITEQESETGSAPGGGEGTVAQIMYTHVSKCKDDKINK
jgi:hypothetical protein